ncbi:MAG: chemotaxis protein CheB, partial [Myxococcota bacterium]|nr:chemotaxis protein CheB [Myxococcota bacterium]
MSVDRAIAIGASAGGLDVIREIVRALPRDLPAAVFVVMHVPRAARSMLPEILARSTRLTVVSPRDGHPVEAAHVYVAPPDHHMVLHGGALRLSRGPVENHHRPAIDPLFRSVAASCGAGAVGVIVSGNLDDGTAGLLAIQRAGGTTVVQSPEEAMYSGMPRSAVEHVSVDHVVSGSEIGPVVAKLVMEPPKAEPVRAAAAPLSEARIAEFDVQAAHEAQRAAVPSSFVCPDCGGTLFEVNDGDLVRYRCRVGHAYGLEGLLGQKAADVEGALWSAVRALEE